MAKLRFKVHAVTTSRKDEIIVETAHQPDPVLWEPDFKTRRMSR